MAHAPLSSTSWNKAIVDRLLPRRSAGTAACLALDDEVLLEIVRSEARTPFGIAAQREFVDSTVGRWFTRSRAIPERHVLEALRWRGTSEVPPYVGLLALCVLAANKMAADPGRGIQPNDYYTHLNALIGRDRKGAPPGFDALDSLWLDLDKWLSEAGDRGTSTIRTHPTLTHIGYPISQAILSRRERRLLPDFFSAVGLEPGQPCTAEELLHHFRSWALVGSHLRQVTVDRVRAGDMDLLLGGILESELADWNGTRWDSDGRVREDIAIHLRTKKAGRLCTVSYWPRHTENAPASLDCEGVTLELSHSDDWYRPIDPEDLGFPHPLTIEVSLTDQAQTLSFVRRPRPVVPLHRDIEMGWVEVTRIRLGEELALIVREDHRAEIERFLASRGEIGQTHKPDGLPQGWFLILRATVTDPSPLVDGLPHGVSAILPRPVSGLHLHGGLRTDRAEYLVGEEPDLYAHPLEPTTLVIDGESEEIRPGPLRSELTQMNLAEGEHSLSLPPQGRRFLTTCGRQGITPHRAGRVGFIIESASGVPRLARPEADHAPVQVDPHHVLLAGGAVRAGPHATLGAELHRPVLLHRHPLVVVLGEHPGEIEELEPPAAPNWLNRIDARNTWPMFEAVFSFCPCFALHELTTGAWVASWLSDPSSSLPAASTALPDEAITAWRSRVLSVDAARVHLRHQAAWLLLRERALTEVGA